jgi:hypothetical protein
MLLSKLPDQKQDPSTEVPQPQSSSAESSPPQEWPLVGVSLLFLHDAVDHVRIGFEPAGQTEGSQNRIDHHPKPKTAYCDCICQLLRAGFCRKLAFPGHSPVNSDTTALSFRTLGRSDAGGGTGRLQSAVPGTGLRQIGQCETQERKGVRRSREIPGTE